MKKILIITDSLGLPRPSPEEVKYDQTWVYKLSQEYKVHQFSYGGGIIGELYSQIEYLKMFNPDIVVIQSGIVDCAPRALSKFENEFLNKFWLTRKFLKKFLNQKRVNYLRKKRNRVYTNIKTYESFVNRFKLAFSENLFWVGIVPAGNDYESKVPGIRKQVEMYNQLLKSKLGENYIDLNNFTESHVMSDHIHLTVIGHNSVYEKIKKILEK